MAFERIVNLFTLKTLNFYCQGTHLLLGCMLLTEMAIYNLSLRKEKTSVGSINLPKDLKISKNSTIKDLQQVLTAMFKSQQSQIKYSTLWKRASVFCMEKRKEKGT